MYRETRALYSYRQKCSNITIIYLGLEDDDEDDEDLELGEDGDKVSNFKSIFYIWKNIVYCPISICKIRKKCSCWFLTKGTQGEYKEYRAAAADAQDTTYHCS